MLSDLVNCADIRVVQSRGRSGFAPEPLQRGFIVSNFVRKELQSYEAAEFRIFGFKNNSHAATAKFFQDAVMRDRLSEHAPRILRGWPTQVNKTNVEPAQGEWNAHRENTKQKKHGQSRA